MKSIQIKRRPSQSSIRLIIICSFALFITAFATIRPSFISPIQSAQEKLTG